MILASHNTMTYLPPKKWWMKIFKSIYQCQNIAFWQQIDLGVKYFDIRISFDKFGQPEFRHGFVAFKGDVLTLFKLLNEENNIICRIVLERVTDDIDYDLFRALCKTIQEQYSNITFTCGEYKKTKEVIYDFENHIPATEMYGSVRGKGLEKIFPKLYAKRYNKELKEQYIDKGYLMIDFV